MIIYDGVVLKMKGGVERVEKCARFTLQYHLNYK